MPQRAEVPDHLKELAQQLPLTLLLTDVQTVLKISPRQVRRLLAARELRFIRARRGGSSRVVVPRSEVLRWLIEHSI